MAANRSCTLHERSVPQSVSQLHKSFGPHSRKIAGSELGRGGSSAFDRYLGYYTGQQAGSSLIAR